MSLWSADLRTAEALADFIIDLRAEHGNPSQPMGVYVVDGLDPRSALGRAVELERFGSSFGNDVDLLRQLYGCFETAGVTQFVCVVDHRRQRPAGVIRLIRNTAELGCRILNDLQHQGDNGWGLTMDEIRSRSAFVADRPEQILDLPTIAVSEVYAGAEQVDGVSRALCSSIVQYCLTTDGIETLVCSLDRVPYQLIQAYTDDGFSEFDGVSGQPYYGAHDTVPLWGNWKSYLRRVQRSSVDTYARLVHLDGLDNYYFARRGDDHVIDLTDAARARRVGSEA